MCGGVSYPTSQNRQEFIVELIVVRTHENPKKLSKTHELNNVNFYPGSICLRYSKYMQNLITPHFPSAITVVQATIIPCLITDCQSLLSGSLFALIHLQFVLNTAAGVMPFKMQIRLYLFSAQNPQTVSLLSAGENPSPCLPQSKLDLLSCYPQNPCLLPAFQPCQQVSPQGICPAEASSWNPISLKFTVP